MNRPSTRLVILAGPSCVGKSPLWKALSRFHPGLAKNLRPLVLYNSRDPRPGELDGIHYHFRSSEQILELDDDDNFVVMNVRGDTQALDIRQLEHDLSRGDVIFEGNPFVGEVLQTHPKLETINRLSVFMSPLSRKEILYLRSRPSVDLPGLVTDVMRRKLLRRTRRQKGELSLRDLENIETRASSAYCELQKAHRFQYVIPNHDGEDSENWEAFYFPLGEAGLALAAFAALLSAASAEGVETWEDALLP
jgi:guanylate kinase